MLTNPFARLSLFALAIATALLCFAQADNSVPGLSLTTPDRLQDPGWWPTKGDPAAKDYVGEAACANCHAGITTTQHTTPMYHAGTRAANSAILAQHPELKFQQGPYVYSIRSEKFSVSNGGGSASKRITWAFGNGEIGQTYILEDNGRYTEGRISYYTALRAPNITTGQSIEIPANLQKAFGKELGIDDAQHCFSCHTTAVITSGNFDPEHAIPGVTCEACHGPGAKHVAAMTAGQYDQAATITNPASMSPTDSADFCGACHRTWSDVTMLLPANIGIVAVRFQPYRLEKSRCWGKAGDSRITCIACHDPHQPLVRDLASYDAKCLACHRSLAGHSQPRATAPACKVATSNCASCHMPKYEVPQTHATFTDHDIRIVRAGNTFPQ